MLLACISDWGLPLGQGAQKDIGFVVRGGVQRCGPAAGCKNMRASGLAGRDPKP